MTSLPPLTPTARQGNTAFAVSIALLLLRLSLGWAFIFHGAQKVFGAFDGPGMETWTKAIAGMGLPGFLPTAAWAAMAAYGELIGGICVFVGLLSRLGTLPIIVSMAVAIETVHGKNGFGGFRDNTGVMQTGYEYNIALLAICAAILIAGPGMISLDALLFKRGFLAHGPQPLSNPVQPISRYPS